MNVLFLQRSSLVNCLINLLNFNRNITVQWRQTQEILPRKFLSFCIIGKGMSEPQLGFILVGSKIIKLCHILGSIHFLEGGGGGPEESL